MIIKWINETRSEVFKWIATDVDDSTPLVRKANSGTAWGKLAPNFSYYFVFQLVSESTSSLKI